jgi:hypothetical protein
MTHTREFLKKESCLYARRDGVGRCGVIVPRTICLRTKWRWGVRSTRYYRGRSLQYPYTGTGPPQSARTFRRRHNPHALLSSRTRMEIHGVPSWSCSKAVCKSVWHMPLPSVQWINSWWWTEELSETRRVSCQNKFVKLVHLVGFIIKKSVTMHGHTNVKKCHEVCTSIWEHVLWNNLRCYNLAFLFCFRWGDLWQLTYLLAGWQFTVFVKGFTHGLAAPNNKERPRK